MKRRTNMALHAMGALLCMALFLSCGKSDKAAASKTYRFGDIVKGSIEKTVSSSGKLEAVSTVDVLSEMSGRVEAVHASYNDKVAKGQVLVELNTEMLKLEEVEARATLKKVQANYALQQLDYQNKSKLAEKGLISEYDLVSAKTSMEVQEAELDSAKASLSVIETKINQYAYIKSPINGVVLERNVDVGQSVVEGSSSSSESLFTLSENLARMEINTSVDELDIAGIKKGQNVRFTVEALPNQSFVGTVKELRLVPTTTNNVVSYSVMVSTDNASGKLLPGMSAEVTFIQEEQNDVLLVPNAALRYTPSSLSADEVARRQFLARVSKMPEAERQKAIADYDKQKAEAAKAKGSKGGTSGLSSLVMGGGGRPGGPGGGPGGPGGPPGGGESSRRKAASGSGSDNQGSSQGLADGAENFDPASIKSLWYLDDKGELAVRLVTAGTTDGSKTVVKSRDDDLEGLKVILQEVVK